MGRGGGLVEFEAVRLYLTKGSYADGTAKVHKRAIRLASANFRVNDKGRLIYIGKDGMANRVVLETTSEQREALVDCHSAATGGHCGIKKTVAKITSAYYWPTISPDVKEYIACCDRCQRINPSLKSGAVDELHPVGFRTGALRQWGIDIVCLQESASGNRYIVAATDYFSKWPEAAAIEHKDAVSVAQFLFELYCRHGAAEVLISDQGREFVNSVHQTLAETFGVEHRITSAYHPQTNGLQERMNQTLVKSLQKVVEDTDAPDWDKKLPAVLFAARTTVQASTGFSPFFVLYGREATLPLQLKLSAPTDPGEASEALITQLDEKRKELFSTVEKKRQYDAKRSKCVQVIKPGNEVLLKNVRKGSMKQNKLGAGPNWHAGPYLVDDVTPNGLCMLRNPETGVQLKTAYNLAHVRLYKRPAPCVSSTADISQARPASDSESDSTIAPAPAKQFRTQSDSPEDRSDCDYNANPTSNSAWLTDQQIHAAQQILHRQHPNIDGLNDPIAELHWPHPTGTFVQIMHIGVNHWLTVSNVFAAEPCAVQVYDSLYRDASPDLVTRLARYLVLPYAELKVQVMNCQKQLGSDDCGLFAIAWSSALCAAVDPTKLELEQPRLRLAFSSYLAADHIPLFDSVQRRCRVPVALTRATPLHCHCRQPAANRPMVNCNGCRCWFHMDCVDVVQDLPDKWYCGNCAQ